MTFVAVCLALAGCKSTNSSGGGATAKAGDPKAPFLGAPTPTTPVPDDPAPAGGRASPASSGPAPKAGVLAGQVLDEFNRGKPEAVIQVIDLDAPRDGPKPLKVLADKDGNFYIAGLEGGHAYRLVARFKDGVRILTGTRHVVAPSVRIAIFLNQELPLTEGGMEVASQAGAHT